MSAPKCAHAEQAPEAWDVADDGTKTPIVLWLCNWIDANPERLVGAPTWLLGRAQSYPIDEARDCVGCRAFKAKGDA